MASVVTRQLRLTQVQPEPDSDSPGRRRDGCRRIIRDLEPTGAGGAPSRSETRTLTADSQYLGITGMVETT